MSAEADRLRSLLLSLEHERKVYSELSDEISKQRNLLDTVDVRIQELKQERMQCSRRAGVYLDMLTGRAPIPELDEQGQWTDRDISAEIMAQLGESGKQ